MSAASVRNMAMTAANSDRDADGDTRGPGSEHTTEALSEVPTRKH